MEPQSDLSTVLDQAPILVQGMLFALLLAGLTLWLLGAKIARPLGALTGLVAGGLGALVAGQHLEAGSLLLPLTISGAIVGCLGAWLLYRLWMGLVFGTILAVTVPTAALLFQPEPPQDQRVDLSAPPPVQETPESHWQRVQSTAAHVEAEARAWWDRRAAEAGPAVMVTAAAAGLCGLLAGLLAPNVSASFLSALLGAVLLFYAASSLLQVYVPTWAGRLPSSPEPLLLALGLITATGILVQWTILRHKTDNAS